MSATFFSNKDRHKTLRRIIGATFCLLLCASCGNNGNNQNEGNQIDYNAVVTPSFDADSAMAYLSAQVDMGPRVPGSQSQRRCADYLTRQMEKWCDTVIAQPFSTTLWDGTTAHGTNIIGSLNPSATKRILIAAHWDSRLWADHDPDPTNHRRPIDGANDGASGVAVIMEMARAMSSQPPTVGVDFVLFDLEDQGTPEWGNGGDENTWCKGSQYWATHPHTPFYSAIYGILFDMVGTANPRFTQEEISRQYASTTLNKVWTTAAALGYGNIFLTTKTDPILDDHYYINRIANIPTIDIVQNSDGCSFFPYWHTVGDNKEVIEPSTLKLVGEVVMKTIYADYPGKNK